MSIAQEDLEAAIKAVLKAADDQGDEFKRRLKQLINNVMVGDPQDNDVKEVIQLAVVQDDTEE